MSKPEMSIREIDLELLSEDAEAEIQYLLGLELNREGVNMYEQVKAKRKAVLQAQAELTRKQIIAILKAGIKLERIKFNSDKWTYSSHPNYVVEIMLMRQLEANQMTIDEALR